ncbi:MerR family transcriptional regulator [bacterium]|nr:MerR family transcriptional regulator [bacterium]
MVDYLCRMDMVVPRGRRDRGKGRRRRYTFADLVLLRVLGQLLKCGVTVARLRKAIRALREEHDFGDPRSLPAQTLITDGRTIYLKSGTTLEDLTADGQYALAFVRIELVSTDLQKTIDGTTRARKRTPTIARPRARAAGAGQSIRTGP